VSLYSNPYNLYFNTSYIISLVNREFLKANYPNIEVRKIVTPITIRGISEKKYKASKYIKVNLYLLGGEGNSALISRELYLVDNLLVRALISVDIIKPEGFTIDLKRNIIYIIVYNDIKLLIQVY